MTELTYADQRLRPPSAQDMLLNFFGGYVVARDGKDPATEPPVPTAAAIAACAGPASASPRSGPP